MLQRRDDRAARFVPLAVLALVSLNLAVLAFELWLAAGEGGGLERVGLFVERWGLVPRELLRGAARSDAAPSGFWLTPLTALFIHGGLPHLAANLVVLSLFGPRLEARVGHARFCVLYLACGLIAAAAHVVSDPASYAATIGASGAVSGVLGAWAVSGPTASPRPSWRDLRWPAALLLLGWIALQLGSGLGPWGRSGVGVAWWAHLGGLAAGALLARPLWVRHPAGSRLRI